MSVAATLLDTCLRFRLGSERYALRSHLKTALDQYVVKFGDSEREPEATLNPKAAARFDYLNRCLVALGFALFYSDVRKTFLLALRKAKSGRLDEATTLLANLRFRIGFGEDLWLPDPVYYSIWLVRWRYGATYKIADEIISQSGSDAEQVMIAVAEAAASDNLDAVLVSSVAGWLDKYGELALKFEKFAERITPRNMLCP